MATHSKIRYGKPRQAVEAYQTAISMKSNNPAAYLNHWRSTYQEQDKLGEAIKAYNKAVSFKPDFAEAHHNLSTIKKYTVEDEHFLQVQELYKREDLNEDDRCFLSFALAKMYEDIGELDQAFHYLSKGNALQKKLLNYSIEQDEKLFETLKRRSPFY